MDAHPQTCTCADCGQTTEFLDFSFQLPDCVWAQPAAQRAKHTNNFATLDARCFVRVLLPIKLEGRREFRYGLWLEVDRTTYDEISDSWDDRARYPALHFTGKIASAALPWNQRILGVAVDVGVRNPDWPLFVSSSSAPWLQKIIEDGWTAEEYELNARILLAI